MNGCVCGKRVSSTKSHKLSKLSLFCGQRCELVRPCCISGTYAGIPKLTTTGFPSCSVSLAVDARVRFEFSCGGQLHANSSNEYVRGTTRAHSNERTRSNEVIWSRLGYIPEISEERPLGQMKRTIKKVRCSYGYCMQADRISVTLGKAGVQGAPAASLFFLCTWAWRRSRDRRKK